MKMLGLLVAVLAVVLLSQPGPARSSGGAPRWPAAWKVTPGAELQAAVKAASAEYGVPVLLLYAILFVETGKTFKTQIRGKYHGGNSDTWRDSYKRYRNQTIPGSSIKWGEKFKLEDWRAYGAAQVHPVNLWSVILPADAPLAAGLEIKANLRAGARVLRLGFDAGKTWLAAIKAYNAKTLFRTLVLDAYRALGGQLAALEGGNV